ncbi:hypothetical protein Gasu2_17650 [Galdieria sulphuraria]|nr:hypothetical protein Gasu2_17650 [Galdieria sulphuraria]
MSNEHREYDEWFLARCLVHLNLLDKLEKDKQETPKVLWLKRYAICLAMQAKIASLELCRGERKEKEIREQCNRIRHFRGKSLTLTEIEHSIGTARDVAETAREVAEKARGQSNDSEIRVAFKDLNAFRDFADYFFPDGQLPE